MKNNCHLNVLLLILQNKKFVTEYGWGKLAI